MKPEESVYHQDITGLSVDYLVRNEKRHEIHKLINAVILFKHAKFIDFEVRWRNYTAFFNFLEDDLVIAHTAIVLHERMKTQLRKWLWNCSNQMYVDLFDEKTG